MVMGPVSPLKFVLLRRTESQTKHQEHRSTVLWHTIQTFLSREQVMTQLLLHSNRTVY